MQFQRRSVFFLFLLILSFVVLGYTVPVKADTLYRVTVKTYYLYVDDDTYDSSGNGEFEFQCAFTSYPPIYYSSEWSMPSYSSRQYEETLYYRKWVSNGDYVRFRLEENDAGPDDVVIDWQSKSVSYFDLGQNIVTFYDDTGLYCRYKVIKEETGIER